jgi:hypothetical protein
LIRLAEGFPGDVLQGPLESTFRQFVDANESSIELTGWDSTGFESVPGDLARDVIAACLSRWSKSDAAVFHVEPRDSKELLLDIAAAWSALPLYGQLNCSFSLNAQRGARVKALFSTLAPGSDVVSDNLKQFAAEYAAWIHDRPDDVHFLTEDREIRELKGLEARFTEVKNAAPLVPVAESMSENREEGAMSKKKRPERAERSSMRGGLDEEVVAAINANVEAAEESLRDYVETLLGGAGSRVPRPRSRNESVPHPFQATMRRWAPWMPLIAGVAIAVLAAGLVYLGWTMRARDGRLAIMEKRIAELEASRTAPSPGKSAAATESKPAQPERPRLIPATELPGDGWAQRFLGLAESDPKRLAGIVERVVSDNEQSTMPQKVGKQLGDVRQRLAAGTKPSKAERTLLRAVLVQCIADQAAQDGDPFVKFGPTLDGVPKPLLQRVKNHLNVVSKPGDDQQTAEFEAEIILRWAKEQGL